MPAVDTKRIHQRFAWYWLPMVPEMKSLIRGFFHFIETMAQMARQYFAHDKIESAEQELAHLRTIEYDTI